MVEFYKGEGAVLAREFAAEVRVALEFIAILPQGTPADEFGIRKKVLRNFPYTIIYTLTDDLIEVIAVAHGVESRTTGARASDLTRSKHLVTKNAREPMRETRSLSPCLCVSA